MTEQTKTLISRGTALVMGLALLYGAYKCFATAVWLKQDYEQRVAAGEVSGPVTPQFAPRRVPRDASGAGLPGFFGAILLLAALPLVVLPLLPWRWLAKLFRIPDDAPPPPVRPGVDPYSYRF